MDLLKQIKYIFNLKEYGLLKNITKCNNKKEIQKIDNTIECTE